MDIFQESDSSHMKIDPIQYEKPIPDTLEPNVLKDQSQVLPHLRSTTASTLPSKREQTESRSTSQKISSLSAGRRSRQRKKIYVQNLQSGVRKLEEQVAEYESQIKKTQQDLNLAINSTKNNENSMIFSQLQLCAKDEDPNEDKINLLLDTIKFRIGASGKERQAKIEYYFKQLVGTLFPALHRYLMYASERNIDLFEDLKIEDFLEVSDSADCDSRTCGEKPQAGHSWSSELMQKLDLAETQKQQMRNLRADLISQRQKARTTIRDLDDLKAKFMEEGCAFQSLIDEVRQIMRPLQSAQWVIFGEKYKYKREISLERDLELTTDTKPIKKIKLE